MRAACGAVALLAVIAAPPVAGAAGPVSGPQPADEVVQREDDRKQRARSLPDSADERARRARTRHEFAALSPVEALALAERRHPSQVLVPAWRAPQVPLGHRISTYEGDFVARVVAPDGSAGDSVVSNVPLRAVDGEGRRRPVDLSLDEAGNAFRPVNPLAEVRLAKRLEDGLAAPGAGVTVRPLGAGGAAPLRSGDTLFYSRAFEDTDLIVRPAVTGFEFHLQVRSADSPERFAFDLDVGEGATLRMAPASQAIEIVRDGEVIGAISAPVAWDADGSTVDVAWTLDGRRATIDVPHRAGDHVYPLLVDPDVTETFEWERYGANTGYGNFAGWNYRHSGPFANHGWNGNSTWLGSGLYIRNLGVTYLYNAGDSGVWWWRAPGFARLKSVEWNLFDQPRVEGTCMELGIARWPTTSANPVAWQPGNPSWNRCDAFPNGQYARSWNAGEPGDAAEFKVQAAPWGGYRTQFEAQVGVVYLYLSDPDVPTLGSGFTDEWVDLRPQDTLDVWAADPSTGISSMTLTAAGWSGVSIGPNTYQAGGCERTYVCPRGLTAQSGSRTAPVGNMPEGVNTIAVTTRDAAGNQRTSAETSPMRGQGLRAGYYDNADFSTLAASRLDPQVDFNWADGQPHTSVGADTFSVRWTGYVTAPVDGTYRFQTSNDDGARLWVGDLNQPLISFWRHGAEATAEGSKSLAAGKRYRVVLEYVENTGFATARLRWMPPGSSSFVAIPSSNLSPPGGWTLKLDQTPPGLSFSGRLWDERDIVTDDGDTDHGYVRRDAAIRAIATEGTSTSRRSGVASVEMLVDGRRLRPEHRADQDCSSMCPATAEPVFTLTRSDVSDGPHVITMIARDRLASPTSATNDRHTTVRTFTVQFGSEPDPQESDDPTPGPADPSPPENDPSGGDDTSMLTASQQAQARTFIDAQAANPLTDLNHVLGGSMNYDYTEVAPVTSGVVPGGDAPKLTGMVAFLRMRAPRAVDTNVPCFRIWPTTTTLAPFRGRLVAPSMVDAIVAIDLAATTVRCIDTGLATAASSFTPLPNQTIPSKAPAGA